jgi:dipeptidyl aminopeptidase/acylaminoacyl peptidase
MRGPHAFFLRSDQSLPIALEQLSLRNGRAEALLRLDWIRKSDVIPGERWQVRIGERDLPAYLYTPTGAAPERGWPCVIWLHGLSNGFSPRWHPYAQYFARAGFAFVALNYSGSPGRPWLDSDPGALLARQVDEMRGFRQLLSARKEIDAARLFLVGVSAGTRILQEVLRSDPRLYAGAVEYSPIPNPAWGTPQAHLPPMLVFIGENDRYLRPSTRLAEIESQRSSGSRVEVVRFGNEGHDLRGLAAGARQLQETVRFLRDVDAERESPATTEANSANSAKKRR